MSNCHKHIKTIEDKVASGYTDLDYTSQNIVKYLLERCSYV